jgi:enamine deaminase RidA (YjgF/YER057c/UK114 family)
MTRQTIDINSDFYRSLPFASGVKVSGSMLYTSGLTARDDSGAPVGPGDMARQFEHIFFRLQQLADAAGTNFDQMAKITIFVTDIDRAYADPDQWRRYFTGRPASTLVEVSRLKSPEIMVEIEAVFHIPDDTS